MISPENEEWHGVWFPGFFFFFFLLFIISLYFIFLSTQLAKHKEKDILTT